MSCSSVRLILLLGMGFVSVLGGWPIEARALSVQPAIHDFSITPGATVDRELLVKNTEDAPVEIVLSVQKFSPGTGGEPIFVDPKDTAGLPSWIRVSAPRFTLAAGESRSVRVQIGVPADAEPRGHYAAIMLAEQGTGESAVGFARRLATLWMLSVGSEGNAAVPRIALQEEGTRTEWGWFARAGASAVSLRNTGVVHGAVRVRTQVRAWPTGVASSWEDVRLLPEETRGITSRWSFTLPTPYLRVTHELVNDEGKVFGFSERRYWVAESLFLIGGLLLVILGTVVRMIVRSRRKRFTV